MHNPYRTYVEGAILTADPITLVQLLYTGAIEYVADARLKLVRGDVKGRSGAITNAIAILTELSWSLDHARGGQLSGNLAALYDYMQRRLMAANYEQADAPLEEVENILGGLREAWLSIGPVATPAAGPQNARSGAGPRIVARTTSAEYVPISCAY